MTPRRAKKPKPSRKRRGLPPGPAGVAIAQSTTPEWLLTAGMYGAFALVALGGLAICVFLALGTRDEISLDRHHRTTTASVTRTDTSGRGPGTAQVAFSDAGRQRTAWVEQPWFGGDVAVGEHLRIEYSPAHPSVARRAGAHDMLSFAAAVAAVALVATVSERLRRRPRHGRRRTRTRPAI
ncbi:hypothetical protein Ade02nite_48120 [Paractinoplanes deccanensis]|uniref:DUF3592 domain-containing protein n=1 Tax=Paractinoplanes deccanensis TaxID=113561 RepID=A0ABQ3Y870_9ACTN|nr:DUF3592 domain-containing protein [Actinoplanes deccanensis]GID76171.1 hypothetical protein Ade02nite_48120 [Actinoplanes deccanensis]